MAGTASIGFWERGGAWVVAQVVVLAIAIAIPPVTGVSFDAAHPVQALGVIVTVVGVAVSLVAVFHLGEALTPYPRPLAQAALRSTGIYALARHPIYSGLLIAIIGWSLWWLSAYGLLYAILVAIFFDRKAAYEERWLLERHSDLYADYKSRVKKFFPWIY